MKYVGMPFGMWVLFNKSFYKNLITDFQVDKKQAKLVIKLAKKKYKEIIQKLPEFEKKDRFKMNIICCAIGCAVVLSMHKRPSVEEMTIYYRNSMMTPLMKWFCRMSGKRKFSKKDIDNMQKTANFHAADRNPYSWNMDFIPYHDGSGYEGRFTKCGICVLMKELGLFDLTPSMCALDYTMSEAGGANKFV